MVWLPSKISNPYCEFSQSRHSSHNSKHSEIYFVSLRKGFLLGRDIALIMVQICRKKFILLLFS